MTITLGQVLIWVIVGALAGSLIGMAITRKKKGFGPYVNLGIGMAGALIGGLIFKLFNIDLGLGNIAVSLEDLISAFIGSLCFLAILWYMRKSYRHKAA